MWKLFAPLLILLTTSAYANDINGDFSNNYQDSEVDSNNATTNETNNYNAAGASQAAPVMSSIAPTVMGGGGNDSCLLPTTSGIQMTMFGFSQGSMQQDEHCNRRKNARLLGTPQQIGGLGLQVSAISVLCSSPATPKSKDGGGGQSVFKSMMLASTPCPIMDVVTGKILMGKAAIDKYREHPEVYIVGYATDKVFWDTLLRIGEDLSDEENKAKATVVSDSRTLSQRFRSTRRVQSDRRTEDNGAKGNN
jgi:hypothetical protein|tara:strand:+ start:46 stop:795 length:750 start_codon:yes stop_codon:yes gene_type:complete